MNFSTKSQKNTQKKETRLRKESGWSFMVIPQITGICYLDLSYFIFQKKLAEGVAGGAIKE